MSSPDFLYDGDFTSPVATGAPRAEWPFRENGDIVTRFFDEDCWQLIANYFPQTLGIANDLLRDFYLINESKPVQFTANAYAFTRRWSRIPVQQAVYSTVSVTKPPLSTVGVAVNFQNVTGSGSTANLGANYTYNNYAWDIVNNRVFGALAVTTSANSGGNTRLTWTGHGVTTQRIIVLQSTFGASYFIFSSGQYTVVDANTIDLIGFNLSTSAVQAGKYLRDYTPGLTRIGCKIISDFFLPNITTGITTPADITIPTTLLSTTAFLMAVTATLSGYTTYDVRDLARWLGGPIYQRDTIQLKMDSL